MQVWPITAQVRRLHLRTGIDFFKRSRKRFVQGGGKPSGNRGAFPSPEQTLFDSWGAPHPGTALSPTHGPDVPTHYCYKSVATDRMWKQSPVGEQLAGVGLCGGRGVKGGQVWRISVLNLALPFLKENFCSAGNQEKNQKLKNCHALLLKANGNTSNLCTEAKKLFLKKSANCYFAARK